MDNFLKGFLTPVLLVEQNSIRAEIDGLVSRSVLIADMGVNLLSFIEEVLLLIDSGFEVLSVRVVGSYVVCLEKPIHRVLVSSLREEIQGDVLKEVDIRFLLLSKGSFVFFLGMFIQMLLLEKDPKLDVDVNFPFDWEVSL